MTPRELIRLTAAIFRTGDIPDPENDAALLLSFLTGIPPLDLRLDTDKELKQGVLSSYQDLSEKRLNRYPLQYLLGNVTFCSRPFHVDDRVLIPRPETELLCQWALEILKNTPSPRILDLCCGSGCIGLTLKAERPDASVTLSDLSADALNMAAENAACLSLEVTLKQSDLFRSLENVSYDLIVSNPPYIPSADCDSLQPEVRYEPRLALDGGADGCSLYRRIIDSSAAFLSRGGVLLMELGFSEAAPVSQLLSEHGFNEIQVRKDYAGIDRMIRAVRP